MTRTIANFDDSLFLDHLKLEGSNEEIGYQLGSIASHQHQIDKKSKTDPKTLESQYNYLKETFPQHFNRMKGFAKAYGVSLNDFEFDFSYFGRLPNDTACSAMFYPPKTTENQHGLISRNLDFSIPKNYKDSKTVFPFKNSYLIEMYPDDGYSSITLNCFEVFGLALEGVNSKGLAVIHLADADTRIDHQQLATGRTVRGFNEFLPIQFLLDNCSNTTEAKDALTRLDHHHIAIPTHLLVADRQGDSFVFEYSDDGSRKVFIEGSKNTPVKITNFQLNRLSNERLKQTVKSRPAENGYDRYKTLDECIASYEAPYSEQSALDINKTVYINKDNESKLERTVFHSLYDLSNSSIKIALMPSKAISKDDLINLSLNS